MTDFKARARELAQETYAILDAAIHAKTNGIATIESALLQFAREVLQAEPTSAMIYAVHELTTKANVSIADEYHAMSAVRAKELE